MADVYKEHALALALVNTMNPNDKGGSSISVPLEVVFGDSWGIDSPLSITQPELHSIKCFYNSQCKESIIGEINTNWLVILDAAGVNQYISLLLVCSWLFVRLTLVESFLVLRAIRTTLPLEYL